MHASNTHKTHQTQTTRSASGPTMRKTALASFVLLAFAVIAPSAMAMTDAERSFLAAQEQMQRDLLSLQMQARVLEQRVKVGELERDLKAAQNPPAPTPPAFPPGFPPMMGGGGPPIDLRGLPPGVGAPGAQGVLDRLRSSEPAAPETRLLSVHGFQGRFTADLQQGSSRLRVAVGDTVEDGWRVSSIESSRVTLTKGGQTRTIGFQ